MEYRIKSWKTKSSCNHNIFFEKEKNRDLTWLAVEKKWLMGASNLQVRAKGSAITICENKEKAPKIIKITPVLVSKF